jgi:hypothetical protein
MADKFNDPKNDKMVPLINTKLGGSSINLRYVCHHVFVMECPTSMPGLIQVIGRVYRLGNTNYTILHPPTTICLPHLE